MNNQQNIQNNFQQNGNYNQQSQNNQNFSNNQQQDIQNQKVYCGNGKEVQFQNGGTMLKLSFTAENLNDLQNNLNNGWVNVVCSRRREVSNAGFTHYLYIDFWKPDRGQGGQNQYNQQQNNNQQQSNYQQQANGQSYGNQQQNNQSW